MAIRIRKSLDGTTIAVCAAETDPKPGDVYLDDAAHYALSTKFALDFAGMGFMDDPPADGRLATLMERERVRDAESELERFLRGESG